MAINTPLLMELKHEAANTRKMLERVPFDKATWKPHEKSTALVPLAAHVARVLSWVERAMTKEEFDMGVPGAFPKIELPKNTEELLQSLDNYVAAATKHIEAATDDVLMKPWTFKNGSHVIFTMPKAAVIRNMALNHMYHHRGQISVCMSFDQSELLG